MTIPKKLVKNKFINKYKKFLNVNKLKLSNAKVEKVVKDPKKPTIRKIFRFFLLDFH